MEKNDKKSIIVASIFLVILLACLGFVIYIKMTYEKEDNMLDNNNSTIDMPVILSLDNIISEFNNSNLISDYLTTGTTVSMEKSDTGFNVIYKNEDVNGIIEGTYLAYTLSIKFNKDNNDIANDVFKELVNISCKNQKYADGECSVTVDKFLTGSYSVDGLSYEKVSDEEIYLKVNTVKKIELYVGETSYTVDEKIDINSIDYFVSNNEYKLSNPILNYDSTTNKLVYNANVINLLNSGNNVKIVLKLYDTDNKLIMTNEVDNRIASNKNNFDITFNITLDNTINYENIKFLSINFINE